MAHHLGVGWDLVKGIQKRHLRRHFAKPKLKNVKHIAIDEISVGKGLRFVTVVLDLDSGAVVFVGEGKGADALDPFWRRLNGAHARIHAVATDMSPAYTQAVRQHLPRGMANWPSRVGLHVAGNASNVSNSGLPGDAPRPCKTGSRHAPRPGNARERPIRGRPRAIPCPRTPPRRLDPG